MNYQQNNPENQQNDNQENNWENARDNWKAWEEQQEKKDWDHWATSNVSLTVLAKHGYTQIVATWGRALRCP